MNEKDLFARGYKAFAPPVFKSESIEAFYQKRFDDEKGIRYYISVDKWAEWTNPYSGVTYPSVYEYETHLYEKDTQNAVNLLFHSSWKLEDVETYVEKIFETGLFDYYEKFK